MSEAESDANCAICYEESEDLRMLPCWHIACMSCILKMSQAGQGRAVKCHACREPFLFENIRSLPKPIKCRRCQKFVSHPKKFPCCTAVYCPDCIKNLPGNEEGQVFCPGHCTDDAHSRIALLQAKICPLCFTMHSHQDKRFEHGICCGCANMLSSCQRNCPLCEAVLTPTPSPVDPTRPSSNRQHILQMQLLASLLPGVWQPRRVEPILPVHQPQQNQADDLELSRKYIKKDLPKLFLAVVAFFIVAYFWGFQFWIWAVVAATLCITRPILIHSQMLWGTFESIMAVYTIWYYFYQFCAYIVLQFVLNVLTLFVLDLYFKNRPFITELILFLSTAVRIIPVYYYFSRPFVHIVSANVGYHAVKLYEHVLSANVSYHTVNLFTHGPTPND